MLKQALQQDLKEALKQKRSEEVQVLRLILASFLTKEKEKRYQLSQKEASLDPVALEKDSQLNEEEALAVIFSESKKRKEAASEFKKGNRPELAEKEEKELEIIKKYLPELLSEDKIKAAAQTVISELGAAGPKDIGRTMAALMPRLKGKAEGAIVSQIVKELLSP